MSTASSRCQFMAHQCSIHSIVQPSRAHIQANILKFSAIALCITTVGSLRAFMGACRGFVCRVSNSTAHKSAGSCTTLQKISRKPSISQNHTQKNSLNFKNYLISTRRNTASILCATQGHRVMEILLFRTLSMEFLKCDTQAPIFECPKVQ